MVKQSVKNDDILNWNSAELKIRRVFAKRRTIKKGAFLKNAPRWRFVTAAFQSSSLSSNSRRSLQAVRMASHQRLCSDCLWKRKKPHSHKRNYYSSIRTELQERFVDEPPPVRSIKLRPVCGFSASLCRRRPCSNSCPSNVRRMRAAARPSRCRPA